jgi:outer membrane protein assembly factor BamB
MTTRVMRVRGCLFAVLGLTMGVWAAESKKDIPATEGSASRPAKPWIAGPPTTSQASAFSDWPQWQGPNRTGETTNSPALLSAIPKTDLKPVWTFVPEPHNTVRNSPHKGPTSYASPVAAQGRAYLRFQATPVAKCASADDDTPMDDALVCLNLNDGKPLWAFKVPGGSAAYKAPNTPCVMAGRLYFVGSQFTVFCLDASTGAEIWRNDLKSTCGVKKGVFASSILATESRVIVGGAGAGTMVLDAKGGTIIWRNEAGSDGDVSSPALWRHKDNTYVITGAILVGPKARIACLDMRDGKKVWSVGFETHVPSSPVVTGDTMVTLTMREDVGGGLRVFKLALDAPREIVFIPMVYEHNNSASMTPAVSKGMVYGWGTEPQGYFCYDIEKGRFAWRSPGVGGCAGSPILADGKLILPNGSLIDPTTGKELFSVKARPLNHTSPALADGRFLANGEKGLACYDLRAAGGSGAGKPREERTNE